MLHSSTGLQAKLHGRSKTTNETEEYGRKTDQVRPKKGRSSLKIKPVLDKTARMLTHACVFDAIPRRPKVYCSLVHHNKAQLNIYQSKLKRCLFLAAVIVPVRMKPGPSEVFLA